MWTELFSNRRFVVNFDLVCHFVSLKKKSSLPKKIVFFLFFFFLDSCQSLMHFIRLSSWKDK